MKITSTEIQQKTGYYLDEAIQEPIIVEKNGRPYVVIISYKKYLEIEKILKGKE